MKYMTVQERILAIQLMELIKKDPHHAGQIGVEAKMVSKGENNNE